MGTTASVEYLKSMVRRHRPFLLGILEPKQSVSKQAAPATTVGFLNFSHGTNFIFFWSSDIDIFDIQSDPQLISFFVRYSGEQTLRISFVYGKCLRIERQALWDDFHNNAPHSMPWIIGGNFNTIFSTTEK